MAVGGQSYKIMVEKAQLLTLVVETKNKWFINLNRVSFLLNGKELKLFVVVVVIERRGVFFVTKLEGIERPSLLSI